MEPFDIDKIIKNKLAQDNEIHAHEMESAKPFVWSAIQNKIGSRKSLTWYHLAAAVVLLMISFSFILFGIQKGRHREIEQLSNKIDQLQKDYVTQAELLQYKNAQVESQGFELKNMEVRLTSIQENKPAAQSEKIIHQVDTVYIKQIEYITKIPDSNDENKLVMGEQIEMAIQTEKTDKQETNIDNMIFPTTRNSEKSEQSESIQIKMGSFLARKN